MLHVWVLACKVPEKWAAFMKSCKTSCCAFRNLWVWGGVFMVLSQFPYISCKLLKCCLKPHLFVTLEELWVYLFKLKLRWRAKHQKNCFNSSQNLCFGFNHWRFLRSVAKLTALGLAVVMFLDAMSLGRFTHSCISYFWCLDSVLQPPPPQTNVWPCSCKMVCVGVDVKTPWHLAVGKLTVD